MQGAVDNVDVRTERLYIFIYIRIYIYSIYIPYIYSIYIYIHVYIYIHTLGVDFQKAFDRVFIMGRTPFAELFALLKIGRW